MAYEKEPYANKEYRAHLHACAKNVQPSGWLNLKKSYVLLYAAIRAARPEIVVDTGVANGFTSSLILLALEKNKRGVLHSVEISDGSWTPGMAPGWVIPDNLRHRWTLHLGDSMQVLPPLLKRLGQINIFFHDSLHTYEHIMFEFKEAYPFIASDGLLLADDVSGNRSFLDFAAGTGCKASGIVRGIGVLRK
jgi:predicted O-methyltransferase YrrM